MHQSLKASATGLLSLTGKIPLFLSWSSSLCEVWRTKWRGFVGVFFHPVFNIQAWRKSRLQGFLTCKHLGVVLAHDKLQHSNPYLGYIVIGDRPQIKAHVRQKSSQVCWFSIALGEGKTKKSRQEDLSNINKLLASTRKSKVREEFKREKKTEMNQLLTFPSPVEEFAWLFVNNTKETTNLITLFLPSRRNFVARFAPPFPNIQPFLDIKSKTVISAFQDAPKKSGF